MDATTISHEATALVQQGWGQLQRERPLAAWAAWQQALRLVPEHAAAEQALALLRSSGALPEAARRVYRFRTPASPEARAAWDERLRSGDLQELALAASAFLDLANAATSEADRASAWFNHALCLAWQGNNAQAIAALVLSVALDASERPSAALEAWTLAEVLRQGAGAEHLADDLSHSFRLAWDESDPAPTSLGELRPVQAASAGGAAAAPELADMLAYEWLDRPMPASVDALRAEDLPRLLATVVQTQGTLRLSSPEAGRLEEAHERIMSAVGDHERSVQKETRPLPLALMDAALWTFRLPADLEADRRLQLTRSCIEHYHENVWIHIPRHGLAGLTPLEASARAITGDAQARVKLQAVILFREQLGVRPSASALYAGYPFDRLRRRLGLAPDEPESVDAGDSSCMSGRDLDGLDVKNLGSEAIEAYQSAAGLRDDVRTARFAEAVLALGPPAWSRVSPLPLYATLVRRELERNEPTRALQWIEHALGAEVPLNGVNRRSLETWRAEIHLRSGEPEAAARVYEALLQQAPKDAMLAAEAAATLLEHGYPRHAQPFAEQALKHAMETGDSAAQARARTILNATSPDGSDPPSSSRKPP